MAVDRARMSMVGAVVAAALTAASFTPSAAAAGGGFGHARTQAAMDAAVRAGVPGVAAQVDDAGSVWLGTSGVGDLATGQPRSPVDRFRIGSMTKTFISTVMLQLVAEGRVGLGDSVAKWLPGVVQGNGNVGSRITVRELLNHTSGLFDYVTDPAFESKEFTTRFLRHRYDTYTLRQLAAIAMSHPPLFAPGTGWSYSNTNYILAGLIIEKVTGRSFEQEIEQRIIRPLGLYSTSVPSTDPDLPLPSSRAYSKLALPPKASDPTYDVTELNPSEAGSAGAIISDAGDLDRFYSALLGGGLLPPAQLREMETTVPVSGLPFAAYGLGLMRFDLSCGVTVWGHGGNIQGSASEAVTTADGGHSLAFDFNGDWAGDTTSVLEAEYCPK